MRIEAAVYGSVWGGHVAWICLVLTALPIWTCLAFGAAAESTGMAVTVVRAKPGSFEDILKLTGYIVPREEAVVRADVEGYHVAKIYAADGDTVTAGQKLLDLVRPDWFPAAGPQAAPATVSVTAAYGGILVAPRPILIGTPVSSRADPLFRIIRNGEFDLVIDVPQNLLTKIKPALNVHIETLGSIDIYGAVRNLAPDIDYASQLGHVHVQISGRHDLRAGSFASAEIDIGSSHNMSVPLSAVLFGPDGSMVQVVEGGHVALRPVQTGLFTGTDIEIRKGLKDGEMVVRSAGAFLHANDPVRPILVEQGDSRRQ